MRIVYRLIVCALIFGARSDGWSQLYVTINPEECSSCMGALKYIRELDSSIDIYFVLQERYKSDSSAISQELYLSDFNAQFIWSDQLFSRYSKRGLSTVSLQQDDGEHVAALPLKLLTPGWVSMCNEMTQPVDTIEGSDIGPSMGSVTISSYGTNLLLCNKFRSELCAYDIASREVEFRFVVPDSITLVAYQSVLGVDKARINSFFLEKWHVPKSSEILQCWAEGSICKLVVKYLTTDTTGGDERVSNFIMLLTFNDGIFQRMERVEDGFRGRQDDYTAFPAFHTWNKQLLCPVVKFADKDSSRYYLAEFNNSGSVIHQERFLPYTLPPVYKNYNYSIALFSRDRFALPLEDKIYSLKDSSVIDIGRFPDSNSADLLMPPQVFMESFRVSKSYVWMLYSNEQERRYHYLKYDRNTKEILFDKPCTEVGDRAPVIYDFNFNALIYQEGEDIVIRSYKS